MNRPTHQGKIKFSLHTPTQGRGLPSHSYGRGECCVVTVSQGLYTSVTVCRSIRKRGFIHTSAPYRWSHRSHHITLEHVTPACLSTRVTTPRPRLLCKMQSTQTRAFAPNSQLSVIHEARDPREVHSFHRMPTSAHSPLSTERCCCQHAQTSRLTTNLGGSPCFAQRPKPPIPPTA